MARSDGHCVGVATPAHLSQRGSTRIAPATPTPVVAAGWRALAGAERWALGSFAVLAVITVASHLVGAFPGPAPALWGVHVYAFFPPAALAAALALLVAAVIAIAIAPQPAIPVPGARTGISWRSVLVHAALALSAGTVFWMMRARHLFLGDGFVLADGVPRATELHNFEPIAAQLQHAIYRVAAPLFARPGTTPAEVAASTTALGSAIAGALFVLVAMFFARELLRATSHDHGAGHDPWSRAAIVAMLLSQGFVQLFFGYVENYTWLVLAIAYYMLTAFAYMNGRASLLPALVACSAAVILHLSAFALVPSLTILVAWGFADARRRTALYSDLVTGMVLVAVLGMLLSMAGGGYDIVGTLWTIVRLVVSGQGDAEGYLLSGRHMRDFVNEVALIGPMGLALFAVLALGIRGRSGAPGAGRAGIARVFVLVLGSSFAAGTWMAGDSNLGYARNWDLLAPAGLVFTVAGTFLLLEQVPRVAMRRRLLALAVAVSLFHTAPWVALNASFDRSFERFKTLELGGGRTESTVGYWYATHGDLEQAERWLIRALDANSGNSRAHYMLGQVWMMTRRYDRAIAAFSAARVQRPDLEAFRLGLIDALVMTHRDVSALKEVDELLARDSTVARTWAIRGVILLELDRTEEARAALARARQLAPDETAYADIERQIDTPGGYALVLRDHWVSLVTR